jgi:hypothetical protein
MNLASDVPYPSLGNVSLPVPQGPNSVNQYVNGNQPYCSQGGPGSQLLTGIAMNLGGSGMMVIGGITDDPYAVDDGAQLLDGDVPLETTTTPEVTVGTNITGKIQGQMANRGWTEDNINNTIDSPYTTREALNKATGNSATAYYNEDGSYVVKDNVTGDVVQISKVGDTNWAPDSTIINPYQP